ncbi:hypothetical protein B0A55_05067 [Friedmanniomyces simplex]|uniref:Uncharacterized protein n=1 Tax=Friedmanniomyces simplex TaxID=329884 RepID=A0A4U0XCG2_9PEZI|nr:hypothetical protein B0A55_05067 [Friedmanniomyces simplex]
MRTGALAFDAVKLYHLSESSEAVHLAEQVAVDVGYRLAWLPEQCLVAIAKYPTTALQVCRIQALLEEVSELADHCSAWNPHYRTRRSAKEAADRADKIMTVIKQGYAHEPEPVLQLLRESMRRAGKEPPKVLTPAIDQQTRFSPVSEGTQYAKWFFRV